MADPAYRPITPRSLGRNAYVPENSPEFMRRQQEPSSYDLFKQSVIQKVYDEALRATGSEERAREAASSASRKMFRTELVGSAVVPEAAMAGAGRAVNVAKGLFGRGAASEASSPMLLAPPRRNAMFPDEMMAADTPSVLRMAPDRPPSLAGSQSLPRLEYDIPTIPSTGRPPTPDVRYSGFADDLGRISGEGGLTDDAIMSANRMAQGRISAEQAAQQARIDNMITEGGNAVSRRSPPGTGFTLGEASSSGVYRPDFTMPGGSSFGLPATRRGTDVAELGAPAQSSGSTGFTLGGSNASGVYRPDFTMPGGSQFGLPALRGGTDAVGTGSSAPASAAGGYDINAILRMLGGAGVGGGATATALDAARSMRGEEAAMAGGAPSQPTGPSYDLMPNRPGLPDDALGGIAPANASPSNYLMPSRRGLPDDTLGGSSGAGRAAAPPPDTAPASIALWELYNESMKDDGGGRADLFDRARRAEMEERGLARGGVANAKPKSSSGGKDSAVHKALEIIHHMMVNR